MDFLDPRKKRNRRTKLLVSYILMALLASAAAIILLGSSFGYGFNFKTGGLVQNGLIFVDSAPTKAKIFINKIDYSRTTPNHAIFPGPVRLVLPSGHYNLTLKADGYHSWSDNFHLLSQGLLRFDYPLLFPVKLTPASVASFSTKPLFASQSPDRRWLLVGDLSTSGQLDVLQFDTTQPGATPLHLSLPATLPKISSDLWQPLEWSSDSGSLLLRHGGSKPEFIIFNRTKPASSVNLSQVTGMDISQAKFRSGSASDFYIVDSSQRLISASLSGSSTSVLAKKVEAFDTLGSSQVIFISGQATKLWHSGSVLSLGKVTAGSQYFAEASSYQGNDYFAAGSSAGNVQLFKNPLRANHPRALLSFSAKGVTNVEVSPSSHFLLVAGGTTEQVYDFNRSIKYVYPASAATASWLDEYRLGGTKNGQAVVWDYDGSNRLRLLPSIDPVGVFLSSDYKNIFNISHTKAIYNLQAASMVNG